MHRRGFEVITDSASAFEWKNSEDVTIRINYLEEDEEFRLFAAGYYFQ